MFKINDVVKIKTIENPIWCYAEIRAITGDEAFVAMFHGHDTVKLKDLELVKRDGVEIKKE